MGRLGVFADVTRPPFSGGPDDYGVSVAPSRRSFGTDSRNLRLIAEPADTEGYRLERPAVPQRNRERSTNSMGAWAPKDYIPAIGRLGAGVGRRVRCHNSADRENGRAIQIQIALRNWPIGVKNHARHRFGGGGIISANRNRMLRQSIWRRNQMATGRTPNQEGEV